MNQKCKVCGEPAAGFHFGAFTCEGCKSFFGRSYNNLNSITECKNNGECVINKKNRTACKACRLRKCLLVGMSKSGSRYGRRSNWFKIHCLLQEQQQAVQAHSPPTVSPPGSHLAPPFPPHLFPNLARQRTKESLGLLSMDEYKPHASVSPESHRSSSSPKMDDHKMRISHIPHDKMPSPKDFVPLQLANLVSMPSFHHSAFLAPPAFHQFAPNPLLFPGNFHPALYPRMLDHTAFRESNNNLRIDDHNMTAAKRFLPEKMHKAQRTPLPPPSTEDDNVSVGDATDVEQAEERLSESPVQENPMDLSVKSDGRSSSVRRRSDDSESASNPGSSEEEAVPYSEIKRIKLHPLDLTSKV